MKAYCAVYVSVYGDTPSSCCSIYVEKEWTYLEDETGSAVEGILDSCSRESEEYGQLERSLVQEASCFSLSSSNAAFNSCFLVAFVLCFASVC